MFEKKGALKRILDMTVDHWAGGRGIFGCRFVMVGGTHGLDVHHQIFADGLNTLDGKTIGGIFEGRTICLPAPNAQP